MVEITDQPIRIDALREKVLGPACGAVVTFEGVVRNHDDGESVSAITYEAYASMALKELEKIETEIVRRWPDVRMAMVHRTGTLVVGEVSVALVAASPHRAQAFAAAQFAIDEVKKSAPIWKKQQTPTGASWKTV